MSELRKVVIVGGGFGGLSAAKHLESDSVEVTLIDRRNYHLFQLWCAKIPSSGFQRNVTLLHSEECRFTLACHDMRAQLIRCSFILRLEHRAKASLSLYRCRTRRRSGVLELIRNGKE